EPGFGHLLDRVPGTLAAEPRIFHSAIGHVVDAVGGYVVHHDAADLDLVERMQRVLDVGGEDAGLQPVGRAVDLHHGVGDRVERGQHDQGCKDLLHADLRV